ncbi:MAG: DUF1570 domain-containing protein [Planctomycetota bacterium]
MTTLVLAWLLLALPPAPQEDASFEQSYEAIQALLTKRRWQEAYAAYGALFDAHPEAPEALARRAEIEQDLQRCAFWSEHDEPKLKELVEGRIVRFDRSSGEVRLIYKPDQLGDFEREREGKNTLFLHPLVFRGPWKVTLKGPCGALGPSTVYAFAGEGDVGYALTVGARTAGSFLYYKHTLARLGSGGASELGSEDPEELDEGKIVEAKFSVSGSKVRFDYHRSKIFSVKRESRTYGRFGFQVSLTQALRAGQPPFDTLTIEGRVESSWFDSLIDAAVQEQWGEFAGAWDPAQHMPAWLVSAPRREAGPAKLSQAVFPVPADVDVVATAHPKSAKHTAYVDRALSTGRYEKAARYLAREEDIEPTLRAYLLGMTLLLDRRYAEAVEPIRTLREGQPESLTAGYMEAVALAQLKRGEEAEAAFRRLAETHPKSWEAWYGWTSQLLFLGRPHEAREALLAGQAAAEDPTQLYLYEERVALAVKGPVWDRTAEYEAGPFSVRSDLDVKACRVAGREARDAWDEILGLLGPTPADEASDFPLFVFSGEAGYRTYVAGAMNADSEHTAGMYDRQLKQILVWNAPVRDTMLRTIRHEVLHKYVDERLGDIPTWFNEGLAEYIEIAEQPNGKWKAGEPHPVHVDAFAKRLKLIKLEDFVFQSPPEFYANAEASYAQAWALVHFLRETGPANRARYDALWSALEQRLDNRSALARAFEDADWRELDRAFRAHVGELVTARD